MTIEQQIKLLVAEILEDTDAEKFFLLDTIFPRAMKIYETLNALPEANDDTYLVLNERLTNLVEQQITEFDSRKKFGCPYSIHCPFHN